MRPAEIRIARRTSPVGELLLAYRDTSLLSIDYGGYEERFWRLLTKRFPQASISRTWPLARPESTINEALDAYFGGEVGAIDALGVELGGTDFENRVWLALRRITPGATVSYGELAARLGSPKGARAVGRANSVNPIAIVVPCHRVIGADSKLTGYAGGLDRKQWLLEHERKHAAFGHRHFFVEQSLF
jgi:methylated-DNA-[protein]-cysteine S-methyltransferase